MTLPFPVQTDPTLRGSSRLDDDQDPAALWQSDEWQNAAQAVYGRDFPLADASEEVGDDAWVAWAKSLWTSRESAHLPAVHLAEKLREMRAGNQWIAAQGYGQWRVIPPKKDQVRAVWNLMEPALDLHDEICTEQRPGFRTKPRQLDHRSTKKAEGQQLGLEFQYDQQRLKEVLEEMRYWAGTDGISFALTYWDSDRGPMQPIEVLDDTGQPQLSQFPLGDIANRVYRIENVRVAPNAKKGITPHWWVICEEMALGEAVAMHGPEVADEVGGDVLTGPRYGTQKTAGTANLRTSEEWDRLQDERTVLRWQVFCEPGDLLPHGLQLVVVGDRLVQPPTALVIGRVPIWYVRDGSKDPAFYPRPRCDSWVPFQMQVNATVSKWIEAIRRDAGGRYALRRGELSFSTLQNGALTLLELDTPGPIQDAIQQLPGMPIGNDTKELLASAVKNFEDRSGWNDVSRGQFASGTSGRAILAIREQLERAFAPSVNGVVHGVEQWGPITLSFMKWGYEIPRTVSLTGSGRPDLAMELSAKDFLSEVDVLIEGETMMPLPRPLRLFILDDLFSRGVIDKNEFRRRYPYAMVQNLETPDTDHFARAKRVVASLRRQAMGEPIQVPEMLWMDDHAIHQDVLQRELILNDDEPPQARMMAFQRWMQHAQYAAMQQGQMAPPMPTAPPGRGAQLPPTQQPLLGTSPNWPTAPARRLVGGQTPTP